MGNLVFQATLGGQVNLVGPNTASTFNLNVPAVSSTIATTSGTETLTNKTLTSPVISGGTIDNAVIGGTTAAAGSFTTLSASSTLSVTGAGTIQGLTVGRGAGAVSTNTAVGASALAASSTGIHATGIGYQALTALTSGNDVTAVGYQALKANTTGYSNSAYGSYSLYLNTTGLQNSALGDSSLSANTTGGYNTAVGGSALASNTTASNNTAVGYQALYSSTTSSFNNAFGATAGYSQTTGNSNCYFGDRSGYSNSTGSSNTFVGTYCGYSVTGSGNTFIGTNSGNAVTSGAKNSILGSYSGNQGGLDIRTASNYIVLSDGDGNPNALWNGSYLKTGAGASVGSYMSTGGYNEMVNLNDNPALMASVLNASNTSQAIQMRASRNTTNNTFYILDYYNTGAAAYRFRVADSGNVTNTNNSYGALSDIKLKENITDATPKLAGLMQVRVVNYNFIGDEQKQLGVIAQELEQIFPAMVEESPDRDADNNDLGTTTKQVKYSVFVPMLIKAIQELKAEFDAYKEAHP